MNISALRRPSSLIIAVGAAISVGAAPHAGAGVISATWLNPTSGTWSVATNWSTNPTAPNNGADTYHAIIDATGANYTVTLNSSITLEQLTLNSANATLSHTSGTLTLNTASAMMAGTYTLSGGTLSGAGNLSIATNLSWSSGTQSGSGRTIIESGGMLSMSGNTKNLNRTLENDGGAMWTGGPWQFNNGVFQNDGSFTANSTSGTLDAYGAGGSGNAFVNNGSFTKAGAGEARFRVAATGVAFDNHGSVDVQQGTLSLSGSATTTNNGEYSIAPSARIAVTGAFVNTAAATLDVRINGTAATTSHGRLTITGAASLAGGLSLDLEGGFTPDWGDTWTIMTYASRSGDFTAFDAPALGDADLAWWAEAGTTMYRVGVRHIADLNYDGAINFGDLNIVLGNYNQPGSALQGDISGDGLINFADLNIVLGLFNLTAPTNVPAPGPAALLALSILTGARRRR